MWISRCVFGIGLLAGLSLGCAPKTPSADEGEVEKEDAGEDRKAGAAPDARPPDANQGALEDGSVDMAPPDAPSCGEENFTLEQLPAELLVLFDRSGSMDSPVAGSTETKWTAMTRALIDAVSMTEMNINWGMALFPSDDDCGTSQIHVDIASMNAMNIRNALGFASPGGLTPTPEVLNAGAGYLRSRTTPNPKYLLLATDGEPTCSSGPYPSAKEAAVAIAMMSAAAGIKVFVIGEAAGSSADVTLNQIAMAGGVPRMGGPPYYYHVANGADLQAALMTIAGQVISCEYKLNKPPIAPDRVTVSVNGMPIDRNTTNGWELSADMMSITFYGTACDSLKMETMLDVDVVFGCPPVGKPGRK